MWATLLVSFSGKTVWSTCLPLVSPICHLVHTPFWWALGVLSVLNAQLRTLGKGQASSGYRLGPWKDPGTGFLEDVLELLSKYSLQR